MQLRSALLSVLALAVLSSAPDAAGQSNSKKGNNKPVCGPQALATPNGCVPRSGFLLPPLVISEYRLYGFNGLNDEFIEIYNNSDLPHVVSALSGTGYGVAASDGATRCTIPNGTEIPARGHYLCVNSVGYSLAAYPAGSGATATGDATYTTDIPNNTGVALFNNNSETVSYTLVNRIDAVGSSAEPNPLYREGAGHGPVTYYGVGLDFSLRRLSPGLVNSSTSSDTRPISGGVQDSDANETDFYGVDTNGTTLGGLMQLLGAPGPENMSSPVSLGDQPTRAFLDACADAGLPPNKVRDFTADPGGNATFGMLDIRRTFTNLSAVPITRLRFRILKLTTFPAPFGVADLRPVSSGSVVVTVDRAPCGTGTSNVVVNGTTLEQPPVQLNGGGWNSTMSVDSVTPASPLNPGESIDVRFLFGIQQTGDFRVAFAAEGTPVGGEVWMTQGHTENDPLGLNDQDNAGGTTAADVSVSGRVLLSGGRGLRNATVVLTNAAGESWTTTTSTFGYFQFDGIPGGENYVAVVRSKNYTFPAQVVSTGDSVSNLDFLAQ